MIAIEKRRIRSGRRHERSNDVQKVKVSMYLLLKMELHTGTAVFAALCDDWREQGTDCSQKTAGNRNKRNDRTQHSENTPLHRNQKHVKVKKREGNNMLWILTGTLIVQNIIYTALLLRRRKDERERQKAIAAAWMNAAWAAATGARTDL